jgi:hypothetical protein
MCAVDVAVITNCRAGTAVAGLSGMEAIDLEKLRAVCGGDGETLAGDPGPVQDENTGRCGLGPWSYGQTPECKAHDDCVGQWAQRVGRPGADVMCAPLLPAAAASAVRCAVDPYCPK